MALRIGMPLPSMIPGTIRNPLPMPKKPEIAPAKNPTPSRRAAIEGLILTAGSPPPARGRSIARPTEPITSENRNRSFWRFWCIWGFSVEGLSLSDRRLTGLDAKMRYFKVFLATPSMIGSAIAALHGLLSADAPDPTKSSRTSLRRCQTSSQSADDASPSTRVGIASRYCRSCPKGLLEDDRVVYFLVPGGVEQRHALLGCALAKCVQEGCVRAELLEISIAERGPALRFVREPFSKLRTWRDIAQPLVERRNLPFDTARPKTVDEHAVAVSPNGLLVDSFNADINISRRHELGFEVKHKDSR
jgi:hypothetical protein